MLSSSFSVSNLECLLGAVVEDVGGVAEVDDVLAGGARVARRAVAPELPVPVALPAKAVRPGEAFEQKGTSKINKTKAKNLYDLLRHKSLVVLEMYVFKPKSSAQNGYRSKRFTPESFVAQWLESTPAR